MEERRKQILNIINENCFVSTNYLCETLHYSVATINRDLNELQQRGLIRRKHSGAESVGRKGVPLLFRQHRMKHTKNALALEGSKLISEGMTIFIDGSTTAQYLGKHITRTFPLTVITNNTNVSSFLSEVGHRVICLGGPIVEKPYITGGPEAVSQAASYSYDIMFFSTGGVSSDGKIYDGDAYLGVHRAVANNSTKLVYLFDHKKVDAKRLRVFCDFSQVDVVISDYVFSDEIKAKFPKTEFIEIKPFAQEE